MMIMELDYGQLGFRCGLEIHQQLEGKKLFCNCPTLNSGSKPDVKIERRLRAVAGETGHVDIAAEYEMLKGRKVFYEGNSEDVCLIETDESPPNPVNGQALETAIRVALLLNARIVDEIQFMRKTVVDGSNVSGFQRTALIAIGGFIETSQGKVSVPTICLEEEAAQKLEEGRAFVRYKLDRLGIPLIEIATGTDIKNPLHAKEAASYIGMVLRSVEGIKRGIGTIRQDVNISVTNGVRTEIKGFQDLRAIPKVIEYEINRQISEISQGKKMSREVRKAEPDFTTSFLRPLPGAARLYPETDVLPIKIDKKHIDNLRKELPKLLSDRIDEFAKKHNVSTELAREAVGNEDFESLAEKFKGKDPLVILRMLVNTPKEIRGKLSSKDFEEIISYYFDGKIAKEALISLLEKKSRGENVDAGRFETVSEDDLEKEIKKIVEEKPGLNQSAYMGLVMARYRGKIDGKKAMEMVRKYVKL